MKLAFVVVVMLVLAGCESGPKPPIGRPDDGPALFEFLSSWEPSIQRRGYAIFADYSFVLENVGGRAATPYCEILHRGEPLPGIAEGPEIGVGDQGRVEGRALLPQTGSRMGVLTDLEPRCRETSRNESWTGVPQRFFGMDGDTAYFRLRQQGFRIRFGKNVTQGERQNIRGRRTHPEVIITAMRREAGARTLTIIDVDCIGREKDIC